MLRIRARKTALMLLCSLGLTESGLSAELERIAALFEFAPMMAVGGMVLVMVLAVLLPICDMQTAVAG